MLRSMTAYGRNTLKTANGEFLCELRSVNHRYLDISIRLPEALRSIESRARSKLAEFAHRGKVDVSVKYTPTAQSQSSLVINEVLLGQLTEAAGKVAALSGDVSPLDPLKLLQWPGVVSDSDEARAAQAQGALLCFEQAVSDFVASRRREGEQISGLLTDRSAGIAAAVKSVRRHRPAVQDRQRAKLLARLKSLDTAHDESRLEQELVYIAQKLDVDEELDRLDAHLEELGKVLKRKEPVGRRLDFLMQEFNREANTLSAKSNDPDTTAFAVDIKVLIEQMREQVQNVE